MPPKSEQSTSFIQKLTAPPDAPHVSGRVIQASVWIPRSTHCLREMLVDTAKFTCNRETAFLVETLKAHESNIAFVNAFAFLFLRMKMV